MNVVRVAVVSPLALAAALVVASLAVAEGVVSVATRDGRQLRGVVDARTDNERLWVRREAGGAALSASVAWDAIVAAEIDGMPIEAAELRELRASLATAATPISAQPAKVVTATTLPKLPGFATRVRSLAIVDACLANWDADVEPDGLTVSVAALDDRGQPRPVRGSLAVRLHGERRSNGEPGPEFGVLQTWSQPVAASDFVEGVATYELPFRRVAPEWQFELLPDAVVEVRLGAFGAGNFAASAPVALRQLNPLRDDLQLDRGTRFFSREWHGRNPRSMPTRSDGLWLNWPTWVR